MAQIRVESDNECSVNAESVGQLTERWTLENSKDSSTSSPEHVCLECGLVFVPRLKVDARHPGKFCGALCSGRNAGRLGAARSRELYPQAGAGNWNFKGWRSRDNAFYTRRFRQANPEKVAAHNAVSAAVRRGGLLRPEFCESCLKRCEAEAHHDDYTKPLVVDWLCRACHRVADAMRRDREARKAS